MIDLLIHLALIILMPPLLPGVINRTKAAFAGRTGAPLLQPYYDLFRLLRKGTVFSTATTWVFRAGPVVNLAATLVDREEGGRENIVADGYWLKTIFTKSELVD